MILNILSLSFQLLQYNSDCWSATSFSIFLYIILKTSELSRPKPSGIYVNNLLTSQFINVFLHIKTFVNQNLKYPKSGSIQANLYSSKIAATTYNYDMITFFAMQFPTLHSDSPSYLKHFEYLQTNLPKKVFF